MARTARLAPDLPPLGRMTEATMDLWPSLSAALPRIPPLRLAVGAELPAASPDYSRFDYGYPDDAEQGVEEDEESYYQVRGFCVGWAAAQALQALQSLEGVTTITDRTRFTRGRRLSPLYSYALARDYAANVARVNLGGGDGAIVSHSVLAAAQHGCVPWDVMPSPPRIEQGHNNRSYPSASLKAQGAEHAVAHVGSLDAPQAVEDFMRAGRGPVLLGIPWLRGMLQTDGEGWFSVSGGSVGGHAIGLVYIDTENDICKIKNSHPQYGIRATGKLAARYVGSKGFTNIGVTKWSTFKGRLLSTNMLRSGESEALGLAGVKGFVPRVKL